MEFFLQGMTDMLQQPEPKKQRGKTRCVKDLHARNNAALQPQMKADERGSESVSSAFAVAV